MDKTKLNERRDVRVRYRARFYLLWDEQSCQPKYAKSVCREVSERGMSLETPQSIPVGSRLSLRAESGALFGGAVVKHSTKRGLMYVVGLEFGYSLLDEAQALVREVYTSPRGN
ncbi:MAG: PilZ domain-containing protein [Bryobacteraceae bacterium]